MKEYTSPIVIIQKEISGKLEDNIYKSVLACDVKVDKEELIKALRYDRNQYNVGYKDGVNSVLNKIADFNNDISKYFEKMLRDIK